MTSSLNPESRGGFYFRNGFELLLPVRAVAKDVAELRKMGSIISVETKSGFSRFVILITVILHESRKCRKFVGVFSEQSN